MGGGGSGFGRQRLAGSRGRGLSFAAHTHTPSDTVPPSRPSRRSTSALPSADVWTSTGALLDGARSEKAPSWIQNKRPVLSFFHSPASSSPEGPFPSLFHGPTFYFTRLDTHGRNRRVTLARSCAASCAAPSQPDRRGMGDVVAIRLLQPRLCREAAPPRLPHTGEASWATASRNRSQSWTRR